MSRPPGKSPSKILVAVDGSPDGELAARAAAGFSKAAGWELQVVHVIQDVFTFPYHFSEEIRARSATGLEREASRVLERQVEKISGEGATVDATHLPRGRPSQQILEVSESIGADLIVVGARGLGPLARLTLGSVSEEVVHGASVPVLCVRSGRDSWPPRRVVFGDDGSPEAGRAGALAAGIGRVSGARGLLVRAYGQLPEMDTEGRSSDARAVDDALRREEKALEERAGELEKELGTKPRVRLVAGDPASALLEAAEEEEAGVLVAVGNRGAGKLGLRRLGSVSAKVLRATRGHVLVCPREKR